MATGSGLIGILKITLCHARNLPHVEWKGRKQDPYCQLRVGNVVQRSFVHEKGDCNPVWNQIFKFQDVSPEQELLIEIWEKNYWWRDAAIGSCVLPIQQVVGAGSTRPGGEVHRLVLPVRPAQQSNGAQQHQGHVELEVQFTSQAHPQGAGFVAEDAEGAGPAGWILPSEFCNRDASQEYEGWEEVWKNRYGATYRAVRQGLNQPVSIKVVNKQGLSTDAEGHDRLAREVVMLRALDGHPNVVRLFDAWETRRQVCIVTEVCSGGELFEALVRWGPCREKEAAGIMRTLLRLVADMHNAGIMHRNLKPENILLSNSTPEAVVKVTGFGYASYFQPGVALHEVVGSHLYAAPEMLRDMRYGPEVDLWSCGCLLHALLSGATPYPGYSVAGVLYAIDRQPLDLSKGVWASISDAAKDCVRQLLQVDPSWRPSAEQMLQHEWLREGGAPGDAAQALPLVLTQLKTFSSANKLTKLALQIVAACLPPEEKAGLRQLFQSIDVDNSGTISVDEFAAVLKRKGQVLGRGEVQRMMQAAGFSNEHLDWEAFVAVMLRQDKMQESSLWRVFNILDTDGNGHISPEELHQALQEQGVGPDDIPRIIAEADRNGDQQIDYQEFCAMMQQI